jgi:hypothetical protein
MAKAVYSASLSGEKKSGGSAEFSEEFTIDDKSFTSDVKKNNEIALSAVKSQNPGLMAKHNLSKVVCRGYSKIRNIDNNNDKGKSESGKGFFGKLLSGKTALDKLTDSIFD